MTEVRVPPSSRLPEFNGNLSSWQNEVRILEAALRSPNGYDYEAQLPEVIGYLTEEEQKTVESWEETGEHPAFFGDGEDSLGKVQVIKHALPHTYGVITNDLEVVTGGRALLSRFEIDKKYVPSNSYARYPYLHTDEGVSLPDDAILPSYVFSNLGTTGFYKGPARLIMGPRKLRLDPSSIDKEQAKATISAPPYAIVRMSWATVHESPFALKDGVRALMLASTALKNGSTP